MFTNLISSLTNWLVYMIYGIDHTEMNVYEFCGYFYAYENCKAIIESVILAAIITAAVMLMAHIGYKTILKIRCAR